MPKNRRAELLSVRGALDEILDDIPFKTLLTTLDLFDRLPHKSMRTRICMAIYIYGLASNGAFAMVSIVMALWDSSERVKEMEAKVAVAEAKAQQVNTVIQEKIVTRIKTIKETVYVNKEIVREVAGTQFDNQCTLPKSTVVLHDSASRNEVARGPSSTDGTPSGIEAHRLLDRVIENYGACYENAEKLKAWQEWYRVQKQIFEEVK
jgi:hypothetical protein